ncbi:hypothetical protein Ancab_026432 [Ancistrocladus abbreviatus]
MAADQRKRRLNGATGFGSWQQHKAKKKNSRSLQYNVNLNPHVSLKWDENERRVIPRGEQIGISWRQLTSFASIPHDKTILADVLAIPKDVFQLDDLTEILSYDVWESLLTEQERNYLMQFLPGGIEAEQVVQSLLEGENFHFGNPFLQCVSFVMLLLLILWAWGLSHYWELLFVLVIFTPMWFVIMNGPLRATKKAYCSELQKYHDNMIETLQRLKERCARSKDPESEFLMMRSRRHPEADISSYANELKSLYPEENVAAASEAGLRVADEKAYGSDNFNLSLVKGGELQKRSGGKDGKGKVEKPEVSSDEPKSVSRSKKGEKLQKANINYGDGAKYMSYVKISKKQHELVKSMKQSGNSIQSRTLNRVLGNLDNFHVKPYEMFEKEEQNRILEYWSNLANKDLPSAFANWKKIQSERSQITRSLLQEMEEKLKILVEDEVNENSDSISQNQPDDRRAGHHSNSDSDVESDPSSVEDHLSEIPSLNVRPEFNPMDLNAEVNLVASETLEYHMTSGSGEAPQSVSQYPENDGSINPVKTEEMPCSSAMDAWPSATMADSYCHRSSANVEYASSNELSLRHPQVVEEHSAPSIDLESNMPIEDPGKDLLHQQPADMSFFSTYQDRERNELLHSVIKPEDYHQEHQRTRLDFHPTRTMVMEPNQFLPGPFREQLQPSFALEHKQKGQSDLYMHQSIRENFFSDNSRYTIPGQEQFSPINMQDWTNGRMPATTPHLSSGELLNHNWFSSETRAPGGWSGSDCGVFSNQSLGNGGSVDQSLYSVLSQCTNLHPHSSYDAMGSTDKFIPPVNYGENMGGGIPQANNLLPQTATPLEYVSGHDAASAALKTSTVGWMNLPHQTPGLHDPTEKPFLRSWNQ